MNRRLFAASTLDDRRRSRARHAGARRSRSGHEQPAAGREGQYGPHVSKDKLQKCYGINTVAKNDCAEGAHSCAGQATQARDPKSFVLLPAGDCAKIQGGKLTAA